MRNKPSTTAAFVAVSRTLGQSLPKDAQLAQDRFGAAFLGPLTAGATRLIPHAMLRPIWPVVLYMQVRTRTIDDVLRRFVADGGRQVIILGAGYDCRALRFVRELAHSTVFEIDHPATQAHKRDVLQTTSAESAAVRYLAWNFESQPVAELPAALRSLGHDASLPTLTIWEGVTMYLSESAIEESVRAVASLSAPKSQFILTYFDRTQLTQRSVLRSILGRLVARSGEPFRFGWRPSEFAQWFSARGFSLAWDRSAVELANELLAPPFAQKVRWKASHIALLRRT